MTQSANSSPANSPDPWIEIDGKKVTKQRSVRIYLTASGEGCRSYNCWLATWVEFQIVDDSPTGIYDGQPYVNFMSTKNWSLNGRPLSNPKGNHWNDGSRLIYSGTRGEHEFRLGSVTLNDQQRIYFIGHKLIVDRN